MNKDINLLAICRVAAVQKKNLRVFIDESFFLFAERLFYVRVLIFILMRIFCLCSLLLLLLLLLVSIHLDFNFNAERRKKLTAGKNKQPYIFNKMGAHTVAYQGYTF